MTKPIEQCIKLLAEDAKEALKAINPPIVSVEAGEFRIADGKIECPASRTPEALYNIDVLKFARAQGLDLLTQPRMFYRWTNCPNEVSKVAQQQLYASRNHRTDGHEAGVSVSEGPWIYGRHSKFIYFIEGREIGRGSDHEPLLCPKSITVASQLMERKDLLWKFYFANAEKLVQIAKERDLDPVELFMFFVM